jgi:nucleoside-diphosphate-sugar epimerase
MRSVIAGGHGQIALLLTRLLHDRGLEVHGLIRREEQSAALHQAGAVPVVIDLEDSSVDDVAHVLLGADVAVFAAGAGSGSGARRKDTVDRAGAVLLAEAAEAAGVERLIQISSMGTESVRRGPDGQSQTGGPSDEVFLAYLQAKLAAEDDLRRRDNLGWTVLRPGRLTNDNPTGQVQLGESVPNGKIPRANVALVIAELINQRAGRHRVLELVSGDEPAAQAVSRYV